MVGVQVYGGNGVKPKKIKITEDALKRCIAPQIDVNRAGNNNGFYFTGYTKRDRRPWNIVTHSHLGFAGTNQRDMLDGAIEDAAALLDDCGQTRYRAGTMATELGIALRKDVQEAEAINQHNPSLLGHLLLTRQKSTGKIKGTSIMIGFWGFHDFMRYV